MGRISKQKRLIIEQANKRLLLEQSTESVTIKGEQPYPNTDWDLVHGYLGSKRLNDDLESRVSEKLKKGNYRVTYVEINSVFEDNKVVTHGYVRLSPDNNNPHKYFTTRGSIGGNYESRHDTQVSGLEGRLKNHYGGEVETLGPYIVSINTPKGEVNYKQSFFAITGGNKQQTNNNDITFNSVEDARGKLKSLPKNKWSSAKISGSKIELDVGNVPETGISGVYDPDESVLENRLNDLKVKYGYTPLSNIMKIGDYYFVVIKTE